MDTGITGQDLAPHTESGPHIVEHERGVAVPSSFIVERDRRGDGHGILRSSIYAFIVKACFGAIPRRCGQLRGVIPVKHQYFKRFSFGFTVNRRRPPVTGGAAELPTHLQSDGAGVGIALAAENTIEATEEPQQFGNLNLRARARHQCITRL